jgi:SAM-dependent methyltransferase
MYESVVVKNGLEERVEGQLGKDCDVEELYKNILTYLSKGDKILEIGSVPFIMIKRLKDKGYDISGVDIKYPCQELNVVKCDVEKEPLPFEDNTFDVVLFIDVFEHLSINPFFALESAKRVLKEGGSLIVSTPNLLRLLNLYYLIFKGRNEIDISRVLSVERKATGFMDHFREYTMKEMKHIFQELRMEISINKYICYGEGKNVVGLILTSILPSLKSGLFFVCRKG